MIIISFNLLTLLVSEDEAFKIVLKAKKFENHMPLKQTFSAFRYALGFTHQISVIVGWL